LAVTRQKVPEIVYQTNKHLCSSLSCSLPLDSKLTAQHWTLHSSHRDFFFC